MRSGNRLLVGILASCGVLLLAWLLRGILPIVALALLYAIVTWPLVKRLEPRLGRAAGIVLTHAAVAGAIAGIVFAAGPSLLAHAQSLAAALPETAARVFANLPQWLRNGVTTALQQVEAVPASLAVLRSASELTTSLVLIPVLAAYLQFDQNRYDDALFAVLPAVYHRPARRALDAAGAAVGGFVRGQLLVSAIVGALVYVVLLLCGIPYAGSIALLTGVFDVVPYLGGVVAFIPSLLFAATAGGVSQALLVGLLLLGVFEFEAQLLAPQIVGSRTSLPPSAILIVLLAGAALFGLLGLYLAVPFTAAAAAAVRAFTAESKPVLRKAAS